jgi:hypothetical protein
MRSDLGAGLPGVDRLGDAVHDQLVDRVLDVRGRIGRPEQALVVGLVLAKQQLR